MNRIRTWADGFGRWYAEVTLGTAQDAGNFDSTNLRSAARRAIRRELASRGDLGDGYSVRVEVYSNEVCSVNHLHAITYREADR